MKHVLIIPDGAGDLPQDDLDGRTPLEAADTPATDRLAAQGRLGTVRTTPDGMPCGSDVCTMSLLGYDPARYHTGRAPLEAAALGLDLDPDHWIFRLNLVTVIDGCMEDHSAGAISSREGATLLRDFAAAHAPSAFALHPGVSYRNIMVDVGIDAGKASAAGVAARPAHAWDELQTTPPHDIPGRPIRKHLPAGGGGNGRHARELQQLIAESEVFLAGHEINATRVEMGELPATHFWPWGQGTRPKLPPFSERFGKRAAMITAVDLLAGLARFLGIDRLDVPGQTSYHDTDYAAAGAHAVAALDAGQHELVIVHIEAPDEASHAADLRTKVAAIEAIDRHVVGPIHAALEASGEFWRVLMMPDHYTRVDTRKHDPTPVPFLLAGHKVGGVVHPPFNEPNAAASDLHVQHGHELMDYFLKPAKP